MARTELADLDGGPLKQERSSIFSHIEEGLTANPHGLATIVMHQPADHLSVLTADGENDAPRADGKCLQWTYTQLHRAAVRFAAGLLAHGIQPGMRIATLIPNRVEYPLTLWMYTLLRLTLISIDPGAVNLPRREELTKLMEATKPDIIIVLNEKGAQAIDSISTNHPPPKIKILLEGSATGWTNIPSLATDGLKASVNTTKLLEHARSPDDTTRTSLILFTSGTSTGTPKGCARDVGSINHSFYNKNHWSSDFQPGHRILTSSANFRIISPALHNSIWQKGATGIMPDPALGGKGTIAAIREYRITYVVFIPALMYGVVSDPSFADLDVSCVKNVVLGGDMITRDINTRARAAFPKASVSTSHGMTEGGGLFRWPFFDRPFEEIPFFGEISPLGTVTPGSRIRIRDPETGEIMKRNEARELCVSSESVIKHYLNNTNQDSFLKDADGTQWFRTGDLGMINSEGVIYILGRIKDVIKRSGIPITPAALESCIEKFTGSQTSVVAWPHPLLGQEPLVVVKSLNGKTEEDVKERVLEMFGKDYAVGPVVTLGQLGKDEFPLNATGKIVKREVIEWLEAYYSGQRS